MKSAPRSAVRGVLLLLALCLCAEAAAGVTVSTPQQLAAALADGGVSSIELAGTVPISSSSTSPISEPPAASIIQLERDVVLTAAEPGASLDLGHGSLGISISVG